MQGAFLQQSSPGATEEAISAQLNLIARLRHIVDIVKVGGGWVRKQVCGFIGAEEGAWVGGETVKLKWVGGAQVGD